MTDEIAAQPQSEAKCEAMRRLMQAPTATHTTVRTAIPATVPVVTHAMARAARATGADATHPATSLDASARRAPLNPGERAYAWWAKLPPDATDLGVWTGANRRRAAPVESVPATAAGAFELWAWLSGPPEPWAPSALPESGCMPTQPGTRRRRGSRGGCNRTDPRYTPSQLKSYVDAGIGRWVRGHFISPVAKEAVEAGFDTAFQEVMQMTFTDKGNYRFAHPTLGPYATLADVAAGTYPPPDTSDDDDAGADTTDPHSHLSYHRDQSPPPRPGAAGPPPAAPVNDYDSDGYDLDDDLYDEPYNRPYMHGDGRYGEDFDRYGEELFPIARAVVSTTQPSATTSPPTPSPPPGSAPAVPAPAEPAAAASPADGNSAPAPAVPDAPEATTAEPAPPAPLADRLPSLVSRMLPDVRSSQPLEAPCRLSQRHPNFYHAVRAARASVENPVPAPPTIPSPPEPTAAICHPTAPIPVTRPLPHTTTGNPPRAGRRARQRARRAAEPPADCTPCAVPTATALSSAPSHEAAPPFAPPSRGAITAAPSLRVPPPPQAARVPARAQPPSTGSINSDERRAPPRVRAAAEPPACFDPILLGVSACGVPTLSAE